MEELQSCWRIASSTSRSSNAPLAQRLHDSSASSSVAPVGITDRLPVPGRRPELTSADYAGRSPVWSVGPSNSWRASIT